MEFVLRGCLAGFLPPLVLQLLLCRFARRRWLRRYGALVFPVIWFLLAFLALCVDESRSMISLKALVAALLAGMGALALAGYGAAHLIVYLTHKEKKP